MPRRRPAPARTGRRGDRRANQSAPRTAAPPFPELRAGHLGVRLAATRAELDAVQALRYRVFYVEMGAAADRRPPAGAAITTISTLWRTICW